MSFTFRGVLAICRTLPAWLTISAAVAAISPAHPELLQQGILDAYNLGQTSVVVPAGTYLIPSVNGHHLDLESLSNFEIDARGAILVFQDVTAYGIIFHNCDNVYFHGATIYYAIPPFSQAVVQVMASDRSSIDIQVEQGYPTNLDDARYFSANLVAHIFDSSTRLWKRNVNLDVYGLATQRLGTNTFRILTQYYGGAVGDVLGIRSGVGGHAVLVSFCSRMRLSDLTILNSPEFGVVEDHGGDLGANTYTNITITRGSRPAGAVTDPLFSTSADGFHSAQARIGPHVENCSFQFMPDDGIAVHGMYSWVIEGSGSSLIVSDTASWNSVANFQVGDTLRLIDANDQPAGSAIVTGVTPLPSYTNTRRSARQTVRDFTVGPYFQITLDRTVTAGFDYLAANPNASGGGFVLLNNTIRNHRARGVLVKGDNGTIQGNTIDGSTLAGIKTGPEYYWAEAGYLSNLVIRGNTINNVAYTGGSTGAIVIAPDQGSFPTGGYQNITIDGNTFSNIDVPAIFLGSATGVSISNNLFTNLQNGAPFNPYYLGQNVLPGTVVFLAQSTGVQFQGNTVFQMGSAYRYFVEALSGSSVTGIGYVTPIASSDMDFSGTQGALSWNYGFFPSGNVNAFTLLPTYNAALARWQHSTYGPPWTSLASSSQVHPNGANNGTEEWATRRWTSTFTGPATILGHLAKNDTNPASTGVYGRIYLNHSLIYEHFLAGTDGTGLDYSLDVSLQTGDAVDFAVAPNGVDYDDATRFSASVLRTVPGGPPVLSISKRHSGTFAQGQHNASYTLTVSNAGIAGPTTAQVTVTENVPAGMTLVSMAGTDWTCLPSGNTCTRSDPLTSGASYPPITVLVNVASNAPALVTNQASVSGGGSSTVATASDATSVYPPLQFVPVTPCRIADTRNPAGPFGGPAIAGGTARSFTVPNSFCGIPASAAAYSINVTVVPHGALGYLTAYPTGQPLPLASTLNSLDGRVKANAAIVPAGTNAAISVYVTDTTDVILDINGYFVATPSSSTLTFFPLTPCRIADTRSATGPLGGPYLTGGNPRSFPIQSSTCSVPSGARAYSMNFTVVPHGSLGYISTWPTGGSLPLVSTLNAIGGQVTANAAIVPAGTNGQIDVFATNDTDLVIDINGYFAPAGMGGLSLYNTTPCRVIDTRNPSGTPPVSGTQSINVAASLCAPPSNAQAYVFSATVVPPGPLGYLTLWPLGQPQALVSTLNALDGSVTSNLAIVPTLNGSINSFAANATYLILDISGYFAP